MSVARGIRDVRTRIAEASLRSGRSPEEITLVGCKPGSVEDVLQAVACGLTDIGENRVQEGAIKIPEVTARSTARVRWHLIGHLQRNKVTAAVRLFDTVQSLDSERLAQKLSAVLSRPFTTFLEVQFARAADRFGFTPDTISEAFDTISVLPQLHVAGLMTVAPLGLEAPETRRVFRKLREIRDRIQDRHADRAPIDLSMGMTDDYEIAIEEGATVVRIGRAIFAA